LENEVLNLRREIANTETTLAELRAMITSERSKVIDLPARRVN